MFRPEPSIVVGTAGWSVPSAAASDMPAKGTHLQRYGARLAGVEINSSFYRPHQHATYRRWADSVPDGFRFAVKVPKAMTHDRRLADCGALIERFAGDVEGLGDRLGPLLVQLPPSAVFQPEIAAAFFRTLSARIRTAVVCEPRHATWFAEAADAVLAESRVARVVADPGLCRGANDPGGWRGLVYLRLHGTPRLYVSNYEDLALDRVARRLEASALAGVPAWCIFDNTAAGHALGNALSVAKRLALPRPD